MNNNNMNTVIEYRKMKLVELKKICRERKIKGFSRLKKKELIYLILDNDKKDKNIREKKRNQHRDTYVNVKRRSSCEKCKKCISGNTYVKDNGKKYHIECYKKEEIHECSICLEKIDEKNKIKTDCGHYFHKKCLKEWTNKSVGVSCPNCRGRTREVLSFTSIIQEILIRYKIERDNNNIEVLLNELQRLLLNVMNFYLNCWLNIEEEHDPIDCLDIFFEKLLHLYNINRNLILQEYQQEYQQE